MTNSLFRGVTRDLFLDYADTVFRLKPGVLCDDLHGRLAVRLSRS